MLDFRCLSSAFNYIAFDILSKLVSFVGPHHKQGNLFLPLEYLLNIISHDILEVSELLAQDCFLIGLLVGVIEVLG